MGSLDTSNLPAVADSAWNTVKEGYKSAKEGLGIATDAVGNTAKGAIDSTKAVINGDIELPEGSEVRSKFLDTFKDVLTEGDILTIQADPENKIRAKMIQERIIPKLMSIEDAAKLHVLRTQFQTHRELSNLIEFYGFAPMEKGMPIPKSQINTSQMLREAKLAGKETWSDVIKSTRSTLNINSEMDDISVGRYIVGLRARALVDTMRSVYGNPAYSQNGEHLTNKGWMMDTDGDLMESWNGNDLAEALASTKADRLDKIASLTKGYGRTNLFNEHILSLVRVAADPSARSVVTNGVLQNFPIDESAKLEQIADELEAMRVGIASLDPMLYQEVLKGVQGAYNTGKDIVMNVAGVPITIAKAVLTTYPLFLIATYIGVAMNGGKWLYGGGLGKVFSGAILFQGKVIDVGVKSFRGERSHATPEEKQAAIDTAKNAQKNIIKYADATLEGLRGQERDARNNGNTDLSNRLNSRMDELNKLMRDYNRNIAKGKVLQYYTEVDMNSRIDDVSNGKGSRATKILGEVVTGGITGPGGKRIVVAAKGAFGMTPDDLGKKMDDFDAKLKGTKVDLKEVWIQAVDDHGRKLMRADGTPELERAQYKIANKSAHSDLYESLAQDLEKLDKYRKWRALLEKYVTAEVALREAKNDLKFVTDAMSGTASTTTVGRVNISTEGQAEALRNRNNAQKLVTEISGTMAELKLNGLSTSTIVFNTSSTGEVSVDVTSMKAVESKVNGKIGNETGSIMAKMKRMGIAPGKIDVTLKSIEETKATVLENIGKRVVIEAKKGHI